MFLNSTESESVRQLTLRATNPDLPARGTDLLREFHLYRALTLAACFEDVSAEEQRQFLEAIQSHQRQLAEWAENCPENFHALERMVAAELARLQGRLDEAIRAYEEAMRSGVSPASKACSSKPSPLRVPNESECPRICCT